MTGDVTGLEKTLVFVVGPTASGKSDVAVEIAEAFEAAFGKKPELINTDSVQFFAGVDIGAAKPSAELLARVKHHLVGHVPIGSQYTAAAFREDAIKLIESSARPLWLAAGGSGFYVQALEKGMFDVPEISADTRTKLRAEGETRLHELFSELKQRDPRAAEKIQPADRYRILRALEILRSHDGTLTEIRERFQSAGGALQPFVSRKIGLFRERGELRRRVAERTRSMIARGLIEEVESLRAELRRLAPDGSLDGWAPLKSVGYFEVGELLDGKLARAELESAIETSTMQLAKRQMTWFKRDAATAWFDIANGSRPAVEAALKLAHRLAP